MQEIEISTQENYEDFGRPDIEISFEDTCIFIESKVESKGNEDQLNNYASILLSKKIQSDKRIVYLTKYFESKKLNVEDVYLKLIRWYEVYEIINENHKDVTKQLKSFLKEQEMENVNNFSIQDIQAMKTIPETIGKMEEIIEQLRPDFEKNFGGFSREKTLYYCYDGYSTLKYDSKYYYLTVGFTWWKEDGDIPLFGLWIRIKKKHFENSELASILKKELVDRYGWKLDELSPYMMKPITDFMDKEDDCIPAMKKFIGQHLKTLLEIRKIYPELLKQ
jgi:hypothetical protein